MIQDGDSVQLPYRWLNSMAYGRYNELFNGVYKPTNITRGGQHPLWVYLKMVDLQSHNIKHGVLHG